jgi:hypothetical protein
MGYIKEPNGVDLLVSPIPLSIEDRLAISDIINIYKKTGEIPQIPRKENKLNKKKSTKGSHRVTKKLSPTK